MYLSIFKTYGDYCIFLNLSSVAEFSGIQDRTLVQKENWNFFVVQLRSL